MTRLIDFGISFVEISATLRRAHLTVSSIGRSERDGSPTPCRGVLLEMGMSMGMSVDIDIELTIKG